MTDVSIYAYGQGAGGGKERNRSQQAMTLLPKEIWQRLETSVAVTAWGFGLWGVLASSP